MVTIPRAKVVRVVGRKSWRARSPTKEVEPLNGPAYDAQFVFTETETCRDRRECGRLLRDLQEKHMSLGLADIAFNFMIGGDGRVYEGRGWYLRHQARSLYDQEPFADNNLVIAYIGSFDEMEEDSDLPDRGHELVDFGFERGFIVGDTTFQDLQKECDYVREMCKDDDDLFY